MGRVFHTGQAVVDLVMTVPALPAVGGDLYCDHFELSPGGGFNVMSAAARDGAAVTYLGTVGSGPFADRVRTALVDEGIELANAPLPDQDTGVSVALVDAQAERTFISALGAEGRVSLEHLLARPVGPDDVVYVVGYSLRHPVNGRSLTQWLPNLDPQTRVVFDPAPLLLEIPDAPWQAIVERADVWSLNAQEARLVWERLQGRPYPADSSLATLAADLRQVLSTDVLIRDGGQGTWVAGWSGGSRSRQGQDGHMAGQGCRGEQAGKAEQGRPDEADLTAPLLVPAFPVKAVDSNGAGDAHCGVLMAALARGESLLAAVRRANVAAAIEVSRLGPARSPQAAEIDQALAGWAD